MCRLLQPSPRSAWLGLVSYSQGAVSGTHQQKVTEHDGHPYLIAQYSAVWQPRNSHTKDKMNWNDYSFLAVQTAVKGGDLIHSVIIASLR